MYNLSRIIHAKRYQKLDCTSGIRLRNSPTYANNKAFLVCCFMCHLALEKMLKAHVTEATQSIPVKTHDLIYLIKKSKLEPPQEHLEFIGKINSASIPTRYPEDLQKALKEYPESIAYEYLKQTIEVLKWLKQHPNLIE